LPRKTSEEELQALAKEANKAGVPRQQVIEAKLVWGLRHQDTKFLVKILPEVEILAASFDSASAAMLPNAEAAKGFTAYIKALKAAEAKDEEGFKSNILEAIWLNPQQAPVFHPKHREISPGVEDGEPRGRSENPAHELHGRGHHAQRPARRQKGAAAGLLGLVVRPVHEPDASAEKEGRKTLRPRHRRRAVNKDDENAESIAERIRKEQNATLPWLVEPADRPYSKAFELDSIPRMILLSPEGKVLFNGHPEDPALWAALKKIDASIEAPAN
jgi:hypothetical protein